MKKNILLADNSYTIRRIVELSFSDEEAIELVSLENGQNIREKLLELKPAVVLVDIKLPEMNGYEVCRFINQNETLTNTKVFLIKGGFEPVDEDQLKDLKYEDFITKPFDSKALVITIKSIIDEPGEELETSEIPEIPSSMPEEISEINDIMDKHGPLDFSDIRSEMESSDLMENIDIPESDSSIRDEVLPSEEITQGSGLDDTDDRLSPETPDEIANPFDDEATGILENESESEEDAIVKENIRIQEAELEIGSLTMEEINIKKEIEEKNKFGTGIDDEPYIEDINGEPGIDSEESEKDQLDPSLSNLDSSDLDNVFSMDSVSNITDQDKKLPDDTDIKRPPRGLDHSDEKQDRSDNVRAVLEKLESDTADQKKQKPQEAEVSVLKNESRPIGPVVGIADLNDSKKIMEKVEDKLTISVKEILWEIVPPIAEKIIKDEISKLKSDIEKEYKQ